MNHVSVVIGATDQFETLASIMDDSITEYVDILVYGHPSRKKENKLLKKAQYDHLYQSMDAFLQFINGESHENKSKMALPPLPQHLAQQVSQAIDNDMNNN